MVRKALRAPRYNLLSVAAPFLGVFAALALLGVFGAEGHWYWTWRGEAVGAVLIGSCVVGLAFALTALARSERLWGLTALGLLLNAPLPLMLLRAGLSFFGDWLRYG